MSIDAALFTGLSRPPKFESLARGRDLTASLFGGAAAYRGPNLTKTQKSSLANLESYIQQNIKGNGANKLMRDVASLRMLLEMTNATSPSRSSAYDMVPGLSGSGNKTALPAGMFFNQLL